MKLILPLVLFIAALLPAQARAESSDSVSTVALQVSASLPHPADFVLRDLQGELLGYGRCMFSFASICEVLAKGAEQAVGECDFVYVALKDGKPQKAGVHRMRYFVGFDGATLHLNTNLPGSEVTIQFDFDPSKEFGEGVLRKGLGHEGEQAGSFRIRIRDAQN